MDDFQYKSITSRKTCVVQRCLQQSEKGEIAGTITSGFTVSPEGMVDAKALESLIGQVEALESDRKEKAETLGDCNTKLENVLEKVNRIHWEISMSIIFEIFILDDFLNLFYFINIK